QFQSYVKRREPFNRRFRDGETVKQWWEAVRRDQMGQVLGALAVKIFSVSVNSMVDERAMSSVTWLNSKLRSRQDILTLNDTIMIRGWHRWNPQVSATFYTGLRTSLTTMRV
ncbi:hypothetical protein GLOTRDRAFT_50829, partial [Gloeophyllum trabeum ATCC 11539]